MFLPWKLLWCQVEDSSSTFMLIFDRIVEVVVDRFEGVHVDVPMGSGRLAVGVLRRGFGVLAELAASGMTNRDVASLRSVHFAAQSVVLPAGRESVGAVAVFEFVVGGLADQALAFVPRRELIASRIQRTDVAKPPQHCLAAQDRPLHGGVGVKDDGKAHGYQLVTAQKGCFSAFDHVGQLRNSWHAFTCRAEFFA
jgi:hypothetical protein